MSKARTLKNVKPPAARPRVWLVRAPEPPPPAGPEDLRGANAAPEPEPPAEPAPGSLSVGSPFVRMLNLSGLVRGVPVSQVSLRLRAGYKFIEGEPTVPRVHGDPDVCDAAARAGPGWRAIPRMMPTPDKIEDAHRLWYEAMQHDRLAFSHRTDLMFGEITRVADLIRSGAKGR